MAKVVLLLSRTISSSTSKPLEAVPKTDMDQALQTLDARSRDIFRMIVDSYLRDGEPVGSRNLSRLLPLTLSPATIRNVMSDLEHLGLVYAPHVSAGRLPTQRGLRFFVDAFMEIGDLSDEERRSIEAQVKASGNSASLEHMLTEASQMLSGMSRGAGVVVAGKNEVPLKHIEFIQLEPSKALTVLVSQNGDVENRIVDLPAGTTASQLQEASNFLNAHIHGRTLAEAKATSASSRTKPGPRWTRCRKSSSRRGSRSGPAPKAACRRGSSCAAAPTCSKTSQHRLTSNSSSTCSKISRTRKA